ncbi:dioxygenase family protein [Gallaecimonas mangrovi]|uniref:dioxygenase family protein n=1 Tax=Gallaecimonas mangrovi TaxID=2291597 RepID=UPI000E20C2AE|nr:intradiol ring-cleavage dioxygenase [Gallaecimonas mangrovi]
MKEQNKTRRRLVKALGVAAVSVPFWTLYGCGSGSSDSSTSASSDSDSSSDTDTDSGSDDTDTSSDLDFSYDWATGGTAAMTANFPDDSLFETSSTCTVALTGALTQGPCYFTGQTLQDISEDREGLPMQLCLRVIDSNCDPVESLEIQVWHCDVDGIYSGDTSDAEDGGEDFNTSFCTDNESAALASQWFRGYQVTDSNGRVNFASCFPGWYSSRTIHIHFKIISNGSEELISQFCFPDALTANICTTQSDYSDRGIQDTTLASGSDTVYGSDYEDYLFDWEQNSDGSILVYKTIQLS